MTPWRRARRDPFPLGEQATRVTWQLASLLLEYPTDELAARHPAIVDALGDLPDAVRDPLAPWASRLATVAADGTGEALRALQQRYVETFDTTRKHCLYLTYFAHGDTRKRGVALVRFKQVYRRSGLELLTDELPDHLALVLDFGAGTDPRAAWALLNDHRPGIELLRMSLAEAGSDWAGVVAALCATLPELTPDGSDAAIAEAVALLVQTGPPTEDVGLEPYLLDPSLLHPREPIGARS